MIFLNDFEMGNFTTSGLKHKKRSIILTFMNYFIKHLDEKLIKRRAEFR